MSSYSAGMRVRKLIFAAVMLVAAGFSSRADDVQGCKDEPGVKAVQPCTRAIASGKHRGAELAKLYYWRGLAYGDDDTAAAIADFEESLRIDPKQSGVFAILALAYRDKGDHDRAIVNLSEAIKLDAEDTNNFYFRASSYREKGEIDKAIADLDAAIKLDPEDADLYNARGIAFFNQGDFGAAIFDYDTAITLDDELAIAYSNRGDAHKGMGDLDRAIEDYNTAARLDPKDVVAVYKRANAHRLRGNYDLALASYDQVIQTKGDEADAYYDRGSVYLLKREVDRAVADLDEAIRRDGAHVLAYHMRGVAHSAKDDHESALKDYSEAIRLDPDNAERYAVRAFGFYRAGQMRLALTDLEFALGLDPDLTAAYSTRALIFEALGQKEEAAEDRKAADAARQKSAAERHKQEAALREVAEARRARTLAAETQFVKDYEGKYEYSYPLHRAAIALGYKSTDEDNNGVTYGEGLTPPARIKLAAYQRKNNLAPTGFLDAATMDKLLDEPIDVSLFKIDLPLGGDGPTKPVRIGDWWFGREDEWCTIWTQPETVTGRFLPEFYELPLFEISRNVTNRGNNNISQTYAKGDLYEKDAKVVIDAEGSILEMEEFGGDYGPERYCNNRGCFAKDNVLKALRTSSSFKVIGPSRLGGELVLEYSAHGFADAFKRLDSQCGGGKLKSWLQ